MTNIEDFIEEQPDVKDETKDNDVEIKQESLAILASLGLQRNI